MYDRKLFDLFVAAPMAGFENASDYEANRSLVMTMIHAVRMHTDGIKSVYYAGTKIGNTQTFTSHSDAMEEDLGSLLLSRMLLLIYPEKLATGALVELGYAMAMKLPAAILVRNYDHLPYFLRHLKGFSRPRVSGPIMVNEYDGEDSMINVAISSLRELRAEISNDAVH
jgi:hypothetical protein